MPDANNRDDDGLTLPFQAHKETSRQAAQNPRLKRNAPTDRRIVYDIIAMNPNSSDNDIIATWERRLRENGASTRVLMAKRQGHRARRGELLEYGLIQISGMKKNSNDNEEETYTVTGKPYPESFGSEPRQPCDSLEAGLAAIRAKFRNPPMGVQRVLDLVESYLSEPLDQDEDGYNPLDQV